MIRRVIAVLLLVASAPAQSGKDWSLDLAEALVHWSSNCTEKGCILSTDVLRGDSGLTPNPKDDHEYISIGVAINRSDRKPAFISFQIDPKADKDAGITLVFSKTEKNGVEWDMHLKKKTFRTLAFKYCKDDACMAVAPEGVVPANSTKESLDLMEQFQSSDHLLLAYKKGDRFMKTMILLSTFKKAYEHLLETDLKPTGTSSIQ